jgi:hypothetical protein
MAERRLGLALGLAEALETTVEALFLLEDASQK